MHLPYRVTFSGDAAIFTEIVCAADIFHARSIIHGQHDAELIDITAVPLLRYCVVEKDIQFGNYSVIYTTDELAQAEFMLSQLRKASNRRYTFTIRKQKDCIQ